MQAGSDTGTLRMREVPPKVREPEAEKAGGAQWSWVLRAVTSSSSSWAFASLCGADAPAWLGGAGRGCSSQGSADGAAAAPASAAGTCGSTDRSLEEQPDGKVCVSLITAAAWLLSLAWATRVPVPGAPGSRGACALRPGWHSWNVPGEGRVDAQPMARAGGKRCPGVLRLCMC